MHSMLVFRPQLRFLIYRPQAMIDLSDRELRGVLEIIPTPDGFHLVLLEDTTRRAGLGKPKTGTYYEIEKRQEKTKTTSW